MRKSIQFLYIFSLVCSITAAAQEKYNPVSCNSYALSGNKVIFNCANNIQLQVEQISSGILKFWYDLDQFERKNPSFAVIKEGNSLETMNISEQPGSYEIYTGELIVRISKSPFHIQIFDKYQKLLMEDVRGRDFEHDSSKIVSYKTLRQEEKIYGLGEKNGQLNRVGSRFTMWNSDKPCYSTNEDPLYKSIPFFMSSAGYGLFFDNTYKSEFDFGVESEQYYSFSAPGGEMIYYFIYGPTYKQIIGKYMELTGKPIIPPAWAFGFAQSRGLLTNEKLSRDIAKGYRYRQIPCDIIYQDIGWTNYLQDFEWREGNYDDPNKMLSDLNQNGFKVIVSQDPVVSQANHSQWMEADSLGYFVKDIRTNKTYDMPWPWGGNCGVVDFTLPAVADWWGAYQQKALDAGVRGFWTDMGEPAWSNEESPDRLFMKHHLGMHDEMHNVYGHTWDKVVTEQFEKRNPNQRVFQMTRSAFAGMQRYTFGWSGDAGNGNNILNGWSRLEAQLPLALSAGLGGIPFWSCDISGYCGDIINYESTAELYVRWLQFGAFNPLSRIHHEGNNAVEPWLFGSEAEQLSKAAIELKYSLFPYIYSYARVAYDTGLPLMRPMMMEFLDDKACENLNGQFMFGSELLVAPVLEEAASMKKIYLPKGDWIDFNTYETTSSMGQWIEMEVDLSSIPIFVKSGTIIPSVPVMQYIGERPDYPLIWDIFPPEINKKATFDVYEDDGESNDYQRDVYLTHKVQCLSKKELVEIESNTETKNNFTFVARDFTFNVHLKQAPQSVMIAGHKIKMIKLNNKKTNHLETTDKAVWMWDDALKICRIFLPSTSEVTSITLQK